MKPWRFELFEVSLGGFDYDFGQQQSAIKAEKTDAAANCQLSTANYQPVFLSSS
jgi:hypothetical protein